MLKNKGIIFACLNCGMDTGCVNRLTCDECKNNKLENIIPGVGEYNVKSHTRLKDRVLWGSKLLNVDKYCLTKGGIGVKIAVLDTGNPNHVDLNAGIIRHRSFVGGTSRDSHGHSSLVSGILGARADNKGIVGVAPKCEIVIVKVLNNKGSGSADRIADGMLWAARMGCNVINMSLGMTKRSQVLERAVRTIYSENHRCVIIAAAGNDGAKFPKTVNWPAAIPEVISVGAVTRNSEWAKFSSIGPNLDFVAPGHNILSTHLSNSYKVWSGTSAACPFISGICALLISYYGLLEKKLTKPFWRMIKDMLIDMSVDLGVVGRDPKYGFGIVKFKNLKKK